MPNKPISQFSSNPSPSLNDVLPIVHSGVTYKITIDAIGDTLGLPNKLDTAVYSAFTSSTVTIPVFSTYTGNTQTTLNNKLDTNVFSAFTATTLNTTIFSAYTSTTLTTLNNKVDLNVYSAYTGITQAILNKTITGGTFSANTLSLTNTTGGTISITGSTLPTTEHLEIYADTLDLGGGQIYELIGVRKKGAPFETTGYTAGLLYSQNNNNVSAILGNQDNQIDINSDGIQVNWDSNNSARLTFGNLTQDNSQNNILTTDNTGKVYWRDASSIGSGGEIEQDNYNGWLNKYQNNNLPIAKDIIITDRGDFGFRLKTSKGGDGFEIFGAGGFLNQDYASIGNNISSNSRYSGIENITDVAPTVNKGQWIKSFEEAELNYDSLVGGTFTVGETITETVNGATFLITTDNSFDGFMRVIKTKSNIFDGTGTLDNGAGVTANVTSNLTPIYLNNGTIVFYNNSHYQLLDVTKVNSQPPPNNPTYVYPTVFSGSGIDDIVINTSSYSNGPIITITFTILSSNAQELPLNSNDVNDVSIGDILIGDQNSSSGTVLGINYNNNVVVVEVNSGDFLTETSVTNQTTSNVYAFQGSASGIYEGYHIYDNEHENFGALSVSGTLSFNDYSITVGSNAGHTIGDVWTAEVSGVYKFLSRDYDDVGYVKVWDSIVYSFEYDSLARRIDGTSDISGAENIARYPFGVGYAQVIMDGLDGAYLDVRNNSSGIRGRISGEDNGVTITENTGLVLFDVSGKYQNIYLTNNSSDIQIHLEGFSASVYGVNTRGTIISYLKANSFLNVTETQNNFYFNGSLYGGSDVNAQFNSGAIKGDFYDGVSCSFYGGAGTIDDAVFAKGNYTVILNQGVSHTKCEYTNSGAFTFASDVSYDSKELSNGASDFDLVVDVTGLSALDIGSGNNYIGTVLMTSTNPTETISIIQNMPSLFDVKVIPYTTNLEVTLQSTAIGSAASQDIVLENNTDVTLVARGGSLSDFIIFSSQNISGINRQTGGSIL